MLEQLQKYLFSNTFVTGVEVLSVEPLLCHAVTLKKATNEIHILSSKKNISSFTELKNFIPKKSFLAISFNTSDILEKIESEPTDLGDEFITQKTELFTNEVIHSFTRLNKVETLLQDLKTHGLYPSYGCIGSGIIQETLQLITIGDSHIALSTKTLSLDNNSIQAISENENHTFDEISIGDETIPSNLFLAFSVAIQNINSINRTAFSQLEQEEALYQNSFFRLQKPLILLATSFLFILLIFSFFNYQNASLQAGLSDQQRLNQELELRSGSLAEKEKILYDHGFLQKPGFSLFADQITQSVPKEISLSTLTVFPLATQKNLKEGKNAFIQGEMEVSGTSSSAEAINNWLLSLKKVTWIQQIDIHRFEQVEKTQEFKIKIYLL